MLLDTVAARFPALDIVMAHPSVPWQEEALAVATHKANVWIDLSGWSPKYFPESLVRQANSILQNKVLFGSDFPLITPDRWLGDFANLVARSLPATPRGVLVGGDPARVVRRVAISPGAGDDHLDEALASGADVYLTGDLRHHPAIEFLEKDGPALVDVPHWAAEWTWLPVVEARLRRELGEGPGDTVETHVSTICTDAWQARVAQHPRSDR